VEDGSLLIGGRLWRNGDVSIPVELSNVSDASQSMINPVIIDHMP
jgi:hypothetical protein